MELQEIEQAIKQREAYLNRCSLGLQFLNSIPLTAEDKVAKKLLEQEAFFLQDQLHKYYSAYAILREEQGSDEVLQTL